MFIDILSLFPEYFRGPFDVSMLKRAQEKRLLEIELTNIRDFATGKHKKVDERPYGGGPGMVLMPEPLIKAIRSKRKPNSHVIHLSPQGQQLKAHKAQELAKKEHLILLCGHYEGVDERVIDKEVDEEISIGDYVLTNGCLAAIVLIDAIARFIPGVLGHPESALSDSFQEEELFDGPHYTRPELFEESRVPDVLLSGNHQEIAKFRKERAFEKARRVRKDLLKME